jgi:hypothetical protein
MSSPTTASTFVRRAASSARRHGKVTAGRRCVSRANRRLKSPQNEAMIDPEG